MRLYTGSSLKHALLRVDYEKMSEKPTPNNPKLCAKLLKFKGIGVITFLLVCVFRAKGADARPAPGLDWSAIRNPAAQFRPLLRLDSPATSVFWADGHIFAA